MQTTSPLDISVHYTEPVPGERLHLVRFTGKQPVGSVLMVHGAIENGRIFYSNSGKGWAPFLASCGWDVWVADLRGKGGSQPKVSRRSRYGQYQAIMEDIPAFVQYIRQHSSLPFHLNAHSWGGVLCLAALARGVVETPVQSMVFFGSKRKIYQKNCKKFRVIDLGWNITGVTASYLWGYLPAKALHFGSDNEARRFFLQTNHWVYSDAWIDPEDQFNYHTAFSQIHLPPLFSLTGSKDDLLGHPEDAQHLLDETGLHLRKVCVIGTQEGYRHDYGHIDLLTHPDAPLDHFPEIEKWMRTYSS